MELEGGELSLWNMVFEALGFTSIIAPLISVFYVLYSGIAVEEALPVIRKGLLVSISSMSVFFALGLMVVGGLVP